MNLANTYKPNTGSVEVRERLKIPDRSDRIITKKPRVFRLADTMCLYSYDMISSFFFSLLAFWKLLSPWPSLRRVDVRIIQFEP